MTVTNVEKDAESLTMTITVEVDAPVDRTWQLWEDPRQLERWWGPPTYPATFVDHDLTPGGTMTFFMTGPEGDRPGGWWNVLSVEPPNHLEFENGFAGKDGMPDLSQPAMRMRVDLQERPGGTRMTIGTSFPSQADMEKILSMGFEEGISAALGQIDEIVRAGASRT